MKKFFVLSLMVLVVSGCGFVERDNEVESDETSMFVDNGEIAVWYEDVDRSISLRLPEEMEGYESEVIEVEEENLYGTVERVEFTLDGGVVAVLSVHERESVEVNLDNFDYAAESNKSEYLYSFATALSVDSEFNQKLMDMSFNLEEYLTFE